MSQSICNPLLLTPVAEPSFIVGGFQNINLKDTSKLNTLKGLVTYFLDTKLNSGNLPGRPQYQLNQITSAQSQAVAGTNYKLTFTVKQIRCTTCQLQVCNVEIFVGSGSSPKKSVSQSICNPLLFN